MRHFKVLAAPIFLVLLTGTEGPLEAQSPSAAPAPGSGLIPLKPPPGTTLERALRLKPRDDAPQIRELESSDRVLYLRTLGPWYEVDVRSEGGLEFRGWLKGSVPIERLPPPPPPAPEVKEASKPNPLESDRFMFFWDEKAKERGSLRFSAGFQQIFYRITGIVTQDDSSQVIDDVPPGYDYYGGHFGLSGDFMPMRTRLGAEVDFMPTLKGGYSYGLHRVNFANPFPAVPQLAGQAYSIDTHTYRLEILGRFERKFKNALRLRLGLGGGFFYHEAVPDLEPIPGSSELVFVENHMLAYTFPLEVFAEFRDAYYFSATFYPFFFRDFEETPTVTPQIKATGFTYMITALLGWKFSPSFSTELELEVMDINAKGAGSTTRLDTTYTDGQVKTQYRKLAAGIRWWF